MTYSRPDEEGRALAYVGSILFSLGLGVFSAAAYGWRALTASVQNHGSADWPTAPGRITTCDVKAIHGRFIDYALGVIGYSYDIEGNYYSGYLARQFWDEQRAWTFVDSCRDKSIMVHYKLTNPEASVLRETEEIGLLAPRRGGFRVPGAGFAPGLGILWRLRDVSDWAEAKVQEQARNWPPVYATVDYAEPRVMDDEAHWGGEPHYSYSVDGSSYSNSYYFRGYDEDGARELMEGWRDRRIVVHYFAGNPARSVFIPEEQDQSTKAASNL
jgi:hypothetical protein